MIAVCQLSGACRRRPSRENLRMRLFLNALLGIISELLTWGAGNLSAFWAFARGCDRVMHLQFRAGELGVSLVQVRAKRFEDSRSMRRTEWGQGDTKLLFRGFEISGIL